MAAATWRQQQPLTLHELSRHPFFGVSAAADDAHVDFEGHFSARGTEYPGTT